MERERRRTSRVERRLRAHDLAWASAQNVLREAGQTEAAEVDPWKRQGNPASRHAACLALVSVYAEMISDLRQDLDMAIGGVLAAGGNFGQVANAQGVSRQAARQRWRKSTELIQVRLAGGPRDGQFDRTWGGADIRYGTRAEDDPWDEVPDHTMVYRRTYGSPLVYQFVGYEDSDGNLSMSLPPRPERRRPEPRPEAIGQRSRAMLDKAVPKSRNIRVHELARQLGVPAKNILTELKGMRIFVKSASSSLSRSDAAAIRALHAND